MNFLNWQFDETRPLRSLFVIIAASFFAAMVIIAVISVPSSVALIGGEARGGVLAATAYMAIMGLMFVISAPLMVPFMFLLVPYAMLIPATGMLISLVMIKRRQYWPKALFGLWVMVWTASVLLALASGRISA